MDLAKPIHNYVDALVHPSARPDPLTAARHRAFIASRLFVSVAALAAFPIYVALGGVPGAPDVLIFCWLATPILIAFYLSRTGNDERAYALSALSLTGLGTTIALATGGIGSFAVIWLVIVPFEAALSTSTRVVTFAATLACAAIALLLFLQYQDLLPAAQSSGNALATLGVVSTIFYAIGMAFGAQSFALTGIYLLRSEQSRYRLLAENMADAITRHDGNGAILFASPAVEPLFGSKAGSLLGQGLFDRVHVADRPAYLTALADAAALGRSRVIEIRVRRDGSEFAIDASKFIWVELRCQPLEKICDNEDEQDREVIAVMRDITERKALEETIENVRGELAQATSGNGKFLAEMSHELRTPLNAIIGFSQLLSNEYKAARDGAPRHDYARLINVSGTHLLSVVDGMLDISKIETGNIDFAPEPFLPAPDIIGACDVLALAIRDSGVVVNLRLDAKLPKITADKRAFRQILINLISNAVKFTDRGGRVTVSANTDGPVLVLTVEDTGIGVAGKDLPRLGDPYFQAKTTSDRPRDGTGLGLSIVKGLVALHGGKLDIDSRIGKGTRVTVCLPIDCMRAQGSEGTPAQAPGRSSGASEITVKKSA